MRPLILFGALVIAAMVGKEFLPMPLDEVLERKRITFDKSQENGVTVVRNVRINPEAPDFGKRMAEQAAYDTWWDLQEVTGLIPPPAEKNASTALEPNPKSTLDDRLWLLAPIITANPPILPVVIATIGLLYLWWLAALLFDLSFVWHWYVRQAGMDQNLRHWTKTAKLQPHH